MLIGVDGSSRADDAMAVAELIAPALDAQPALLYAHPYRELERLLSEGEREQLVREVAETSARQAGAHFGDVEAPRLELVGNPSPAAALHAAAAERDVVAIIVGSSHRGAIGRVMPGGVAQRGRDRLAGAHRQGPARRHRRAPARRVPRSRRTSVSSSSARAATGRSARCSWGASRPGC